MQKVKQRCPFKEEVWPQPVKPQARGSIIYFGGGMGECGPVNYLEKSGAINEKRPILTTREM